MLKLVSHFLLVCSFLLPVKDSFAAETTDRASKVIPPTYFGMHIHRADRGTAWPGREVGSWRLWDANVLWLDLEPKRDQWDFSRLDRYLAMAKLAGTEILFPFGMTPEWASARPLEKGVYRPRGDAAEPRDIQDWERYVTAVANRYKGRIKHYELWNEVNAGTGFFSGTPQALLELQKSTFRIVKAVDPGAIVVSPSSVGEADHQLGWFEKYLATGMANYADVISYHFYQPRKKPEAIIELVKKVRGVMIRNGAGNKPLWNTESGYRIGLGNKSVGAADPTWPVLEPQIAESYVARALILGWWAGLDRFYWYAWDNTDLGFVSPEGSVSSIGQAYLTVARWMTGAKMSACTENSGIWICELNRAGGRQWLIWNANNRELAWSVTTLGANAVESLDGKRQQLPVDRKMTLNGKPQLLFTEQWKSAFAINCELEMRGVPSFSEGC